MGAGLRGCWWTEVGALRRQTSRRLARPHVRAPFAYGLLGLKVRTISAPPETAALWGSGLFDFWRGCLGGTCGVGGGGWCWRDERIAGLFGRRMFDGGLF